MPEITVFLGAGFSAVAGVPLASRLFDNRPDVDRITRARLVERVLAGWTAWTEQNHGGSEEYLAYLQQRADKAWHDAVWYVGLTIAIATSRVERVGGILTITRHNLDRTTGNNVHEAFWSTIFRHTSDIAVLTTNYDILPERGLRHEPRPRVPRPGFHYGDGPEELYGGGYPSYTHIQKIETRGTVPLLKLHGSVSWSFQENTVVRYHDCRPAIRGNPAIIAPVTTKTLPSALQSIWDHAAVALASSPCWLIIGYSLPNYDELVRQLLRENSTHKPTIYVLNPNPSVSIRVSELLPHSTVHSLPKLPEATPELESLLRARFG